MKSGKRFFKNENIFIYIGTVVFLFLAIALCVTMYLTSRTGVKIENGSGEVSKENLIDNDTESVTSNIGKTVEEQKEAETSQKDEKINEVDENKEKETANSNNTIKNTNVVDEPDNNANIQNEIVESKKEVTFVKPTEGEIICEYAKDNLIYSETLKEWITHTAVDIKTDKTSVIKSSADGVVKSIVNDPRYGLTVVISHDDGYETVYSNLLTAEFIVEGEEVTQGQTIGTAGNTASFESCMECHLHFELLKDGEYLDPTIYLN